MMKRKVPLSLGEYYHVYNRGVEKREIFTEKNDWDRFQKLLYLCNSSKSIIYREIENKSINDIDRGELKVYIGSYCLMPNHFHILIKEFSENGITEFLQKLSTAYVKYFNIKNERKGPLFESRFYSEHLNKDEYLKYIFSYICLNPVKIIEPKWKERGTKDPKKAFEYCRKYKYSSLSDHLGEKREENIILSPEEFPEYFDKPENFKNEIFEWLTYNTENMA